MKIRNKNRKGSTLALTIIIFAVLMIFASFTLGFMVTENKQAIYHQNKTQAYYIARSGAEATQRAVLNIATTDSEDEAEEASYKFEFVENEIPDVMPMSSNVDISIDGINSSDLDIRLYKEYVGPTIVNYGDEIIEGKEYSLIINSKAKVNNVEDAVEIVIPTVIYPTKTLNMDAVLVYLNSASSILLTEKNKDKIVVAMGNPADYVPQIKTKDSFENHIKAESESLPLNIIPEHIVLNGVYYYDGDMDLSEKTITVEGPTKIYVSGSMRINGKKAASINYAESTKKEDLEFYIFHEGTSYPYSLQIGEPDNNNDIDSRAVFYVKEGDIDIHIHKLAFESDIYTNGKNIKITTHSNSNVQVDLMGTIIAPNATVNIGTDDVNKAAVNVIGIIVGYDIIYEGNNIDKLVLKSHEGISDDLIPGTTLFMTNAGKGYYR